MPRRIKAQMVLLGFKSLLLLLRYYIPPPPKHRNDTLFKTY